MKRIWSSMLALLLLAGCVGDEFNTDMLVDDINLTSDLGVAISLAKVNVSMEDIFSEETDMVKYNGDSIILFQENDSLESVGINDFFRISLEPLNLLIPNAVFASGADYTVTENFYFNIPSAELNLVELDYGIYASGSNLPGELEIGLNIPLESGDNRTVALNIEDSKSDNVSIEGDRIELIDNGLEVQMSIKISGDITNTEGFMSISIRMDDLYLHYVRGTMSENEVEMDQGTYNLDLDVLEDLPGNIEFANPKLSIVLDNATPFSGLINADMSGTSEDGSSIALDAEPFLMEANDGDESSLRTSNVLDNTNSNVSAFFSEQPEQLVYDGTLVLNPGGLYTDEFELTDDNKIYVGYGFEIPLDLRLDSELEEEVIELDDIDVLEDITNATFVFTSTNGLPVNASAIVYFYDEETDAIIDSITTTIIEAAQVDDEGIVTEETSGVYETELTQSEISNLIESEELRISISLNTTGFDSEKTVVFLRQNSLEMQLSIRAQAKDIQL